MAITLEQKGKAMVQVVSFDKKLTTKTNRPYIALEWCGVLLRAAKHSSSGVIYNIICIDHPLKDEGEYKGEVLRFDWKRHYDMAQRLDDLFHDFLEENPAAKEQYRTVQYSFHQWELKQRKGEMRGWAGYILPPIMM